MGSREEWKQAIQSVPSPEHRRRPMPVQEPAKPSEAVSRVPARPPEVSNESTRFGAWQFEEPDERGAAKVPVSHGGSPVNMSGGFSNQGEAPTPTSPASKGVMRASVGPFQNVQSVPTEQQVPPGVGP